MSDFVDLLDREADERQRTLDAEYDAHLRDQAYWAGHDAMGFVLSLWLDAQPDRDAEWADRVRDVIATAWNR